MKPVQKWIRNCGASRSKRGENIRDPKETFIDYCLRNSPNLIPVGDSPISYIDLANQVIINTSDNFSKEGNPKYKKYVDIYATSEERISKELIRLLMEDNFEILK